MQGKQEQLMAERMLGYAIILGFGALLGLAVLGFGAYLAYRVLL